MTEPEVLATFDDPDCVGREALRTHALSFFPEDSRPSILDWAERHVVFEHSDRNPRFDRTFAPWINAPLEAVTSGRWRVVSVIAPTGGSKTTMLETLTAYIVACDPGTTQIVSTTDEDVSDFAEVRLMPMLKSIAACRALMPSSRHAIRKTEIIFAHMALYLTGSNLTSLQSRSLRWLILDETWLMKKSMIAEAFGRLHDRTSSVVLAVGQGGLIGDEHDTLHETCQKHEYGWSCPQCSAWNAYSFRSSIKYDDTRDERGVWNWQQVSDSVRMVCPHCSEVFPDTAGNRRLLSSSGTYRPIPGNPLPHRIGFHYPALAVSWIPWSKTVLEFLAANAAKKCGDYQPLRLWIQKREASPWNNEDELPEVSFQAGGYSQAQFEDGHQIENEAWRFLCVDVQRDHFWAIVRAWRADGSSMLLFCGRLLEWSQIPALVEKYRLPKPNFCLIDAGYNPGRVHNFCAAHGYTAMRGTDEIEFIHHNGRRKLKRYWSIVDHIHLGPRLQANQIKWSNERIKDVLGRLRAHQGPAFEIPNDVMPDYAAHMVSEIKKDVVDRKGDIKARWVKIGSRANHLFDTEALSVCGALMMGVLRMGEEQPEEGSSQVSG